MMNEFYYTIIIPHKNIPDLLQRCLKSVPYRKDIQLIVVDDNSDASAVTSLQLLSEKYSHVQFVYTSEGRGGGYARNIGLKYAKGKWILFADADDFFNYCIGDILDKYSSSGADMVFFNANCLDTVKYTPGNRVRHLNKWMMQYPSDAASASLSLRYRFGEPWCKIIRRSLIEEHCIRFDETPIHNDTTFSYLVGFYARRIEVDDRAGYCVTVREKSVSVSLDERREMVRMKVFTRSELFFQTHHIPVRVRWHYRQLAVWLLRNRYLFKKGLITICGVGFSVKYVWLRMLPELMIECVRRAIGRK
ncbi:glycosyltransferase family 2 protein [Phocaeicola sp.]